MFRGWLQCLLLLAGCGPHRPDVVRVALPPQEEQAVPAPAAPAAGPQRAPWYELRSVYGGQGPAISPVERWRLRLPGPVVHPLSTDGEAIYAAVAGVVYRIRADGALAWTLPVEPAGEAVATPRGVALGTGTGRIVLADITTGEVHLDLTAGGEPRGAPVEVDGGLAWVTVGGQVGGEAGWSVQAAQSAGGGAVSDGKKLLFSTLEGELLAVGPDGVAWRADLPGPGLGHGVTDGSLVVAPFGAHGGKPGGLAAYAIDDGHPLWTWHAGFEPGAPPALGEVVLVPTRDGQVVAIAPPSGRVTWAADIGGDLAVTPVIAGPNAYVANAEGQVCRLDLDDGGVVWSLPLGGAVTGDPVLVDDLLVVGLADGNVVAIGPGR